MQARRSSGKKSTTRARTRKTAGQVSLSFTSPRETYKRVSFKAFPFPFTVRDIDVSVLFVSRAAA